jgi:hypothetical protein
MRTRFGLLVASIGCGAAMFAAAPADAKTTLGVCAHGCQYRTVQSAVNAVKKGQGTTIKVAPGTYKEGVRVVGHKYDGLKFVGDASAPQKVVLNGKNAKVHIPGQGTQLAQNGIEGLNVDDLKIIGLKAENYAANGFFIHADPGPHPPEGHCNGFLMKKDIAAFNRSYGLFAKHCTGGRITQSSGYGHGDSAIYIGETPVQKKPAWTSIDHDLMYENVLGYSGTNSKYVDIKNNDIFNNGAGVVPNTLDSELFQPTMTGKIRNNNIFWNNFNYYLPKSPVKTVSNGLGTIGTLTIQYPTGVGIALFGATGWDVTDNQIFGNFKWGAAAFSDPFNDQAVNNDNTFENNQMGRNGTDTNQFDFFNDGSGKGTCFSNNTSSTFDTSQATTPAALLYPTCPAPAIAGSGNNQGDSGQVFNNLATYVTSDPPCSQQDAWAKHSHPKFKSYKPIDVKQDNGDFGECKE